MYAAILLFIFASNRATTEAVATPITKRDRVVELHYITCRAQNVKDANFEVSYMHAYCGLGFIVWSTYYPRPNEAESTVNMFTAW